MTRKEGLRARIAAEEAAGMEGGLLWTELRAELLTLLKAQEYPRAGTLDTSTLVQGK